MTARSVSSDRQCVHLSSEIRQNPIREISLNFGRSGASEGEQRLRWLFLQR